MNKSTHKVFHNTLILYSQLFIGMIIGILTMRIVLNALGDVDYGIYMLVAGVVGLLNILNSSMTNTSMRFLAHSLGARNEETSLKAFNSTLYLHYIIGIIVVIVMEAGGWILFKYLLNIPIDKLFDAKIVYQFMVITTFVSIISVPYDAVMNSHENMLALSIADILYSLFKLGAAIFLLHTLSNKLILYGFLIMCIQIIQRIIKQIYSKRKYPECKKYINKYKDKELTKKILSYTWWNLFGSIASISVTEVRGIILNIFFGVKLNSADGVSKTASGTVNQLSVNLTRAINPQIMKSEGGGDRTKMLKISYSATKFSTFLFALVGIPIIIEAPMLFNIWLVNVPEYSVAFFQYSLILILLEKFTFQIVTAIQAVGEIKIFQIVESTLFVLTIPVIYLTLRLDENPVSIYKSLIPIYFAIGAFRLYFGKKIVGLLPSKYITEVILPLFFSITLSFVITIIPHYFMESNLFRILTTTIISALILSLMFWNIVINSTERVIIKDLINYSGILFFLKFKKNKP